ncbi:MAG: ferredoxin [Gordonia sp. (in: high G+C Gram-positive bacteria)]
MRIEADLDLCQGHGMCEMEAPDIFAAHRDWVEIRNTEPGGEHRLAVEAAVQYCPTQALRIIDDDE